jgi:hypothetical protein
MDDYFSKYIENERKLKESEKTLKVWVILGFILFALLVGQSIRYSLLSEKYSDLRYEYETYMEEHQ